MFRPSHAIAGAGTMFFLLIFNVQVLPSILPFPKTLPSVSQPYDSILLKTWAGIKKRNVDAYSIPIIHRPKSETPNDAVSEGVGYGMLLALYCNDQTYFNKIWDSAEQYMWTQGSSYNWRIDESGKVTGTGPATDAEEDIATALIFADLLVKQKLWQPHTGPKGATYAARAQTVIDIIWNNMVENGKYLRSGSNWGGSAFVNPGYFAPAWYRVFNEFSANKRDWTGLIDQCYKTVALSPGFDNGLVPDWMKPDGGYASGGLGYNTYAGGKFFYKDAIRVLWRLGLDYQWYAEPRAKAFLDNSFRFIKTPDRANFFQMDGKAVTDSLSFPNMPTRPRSEHSHLTLGMWVCAAMVSGTKAEADSFSSALLGFYTPGADFFGKASDPGGEDTIHNEMYFDQFLAWFGASFISGVFTNLWEDLKHVNGVQGAGDTMAFKHSRRSLSEAAFFQILPAGTKIKVFSPRGELVWSHISRASVTQSRFPFTGAFLYQLIDGNEKVVKTGKFIGAKDFR